MEIEGKKAVIVGGASGFGRATAESLAKRGASVALLDRPQSKGREVADAIGGTFHEVDVTDFAGTERVLQQAIEALGGLHIAVTTAGGGTAERTVSKTGPHSLDSFRSSVDLNLIGTFNVSRLAAWQMSKNEPEDEERGVIINTASISSRGRSGRWRTPRRRRRSPACASRWPAIWAASGSVCWRSRRACSPPV
jgi:NAD(P)-dependent dehydrogenase (short-subunit alcohol dehydrogenase family)